MRPTRRTLLASTAATLALPGCLGGDGNDAGDGGDGDEGGSPTTTAPDGGTTATTTTGETTTEAETTTRTTADDQAPAGGQSPTVQVAEHPELGRILVAPNGRTLYVFDSDTRGAGESTCSGGCLDNWPPLTVEGEPTVGDGVTADLTTFQREDGSTQVAAGGWPLYYFAGDDGPGDANGQGVGDVWWVLRPDGTPVRPEPTVQVREHPELGEVLTDADGRTLYMFDSDTRGAGESTCSGGCLDNWPPLTVDGDPSAGDGVTAELATFERGDGSSQVAAGGWPLYYFAGDDGPGDANGQGVGDVWWVLRPDGSPVRPAETTTTTEDDGGY